MDFKKTSINLLTQKKISCIVKTSKQGETKMTTSKMNNCTFYYFSFQGYYFYPDYFCCNESSPKLMSL